MDVNVGDRTGTVCVGSGSVDTSYRTTRSAELIPVFEEGSVDPDLIEEGRVGILEYLRREGYLRSLSSNPISSIIAPLSIMRFQINYTVDSGEPLFGSRGADRRPHAFFGRRPDL